MEDKDIILDLEGMGFIIFSDHAVSRVCSHKGLQACKNTV